MACSQHRGGRHNPFSPRIRRPAARPTGPGGLQYGQDPVGAPQAGGPKPKPAATAAGLTVHFHKPNPWRIQYREQDAQSQLQQGRLGWYAGATGTCSSTDPNVGCSTTTPVNPGHLSGAPGDPQAFLGWALPTACVMTGYQVYRKGPNGPAYTLSTPITAPKYTATGLGNGTAYTFRVVSVSSAGTKSKGVTPSSNRRATANWGFLRQERLLRRHLALYQRGLQQQRRLLGRHQGGAPHRRHPPAGQLQGPGPKPDCITLDFTVGCLLAQHRRELNLIRRPKGAVQHGGRLWQRGGLQAARHRRERGELRRLFWARSAACQPAPPQAS